jgi:hypothetical protein
MIYCTDTDEYLKYVSYGGSNLWMQAVPKPNRNLIINGTGTVAQRSASSVALTTTVAYGSIDRWAAYQATSAAGTISKITTSLPTAATNNIAFGSGFRIGRNSAATNTGVIAVAQALETVNSLGAAGKQVTLSFWAKAGANYSAASNLFSATVQSGTGTDQAVNGGGVWTGVAFPLASTPTLTTSWAFYSVTGTVAASATQLEVLLSYTPVGTAGADDNVYITGVQLEIGSAPSEFEFRDFGEELRRCQRYAIVYGGEQVYNESAIGWAKSTTVADVMTFFPVTMRTVPALTTNGSWQLSDGVAATVVSSFTLQTTQSSKSISSVTVNVASGLTQYRPYRLESANSTASLVTFSAEL